MDTKALAREFLQLLPAVAEYAAYVLNKDAAEGLVLQPLGQYPQTAAYAARTMATSHSSFIRCVACLVPAFTPKCEPELLWELWENEIQKRDNPSDSIRADLEAAEADPEAFGLPLDPADIGLDPADATPKPPIEQRVALIASLEANSVAERVVISSIAALDRGPDHKQVAWRVLNDMVQRALNGENWQDAHLALALLVRSSHPDASTILSRCEDQQDKGQLADWARRIARGDRALLDEPLKLVGPIPKGVKLPKAQRAELDAMIEAARRVEESID